MEPMEKSRTEYSARNTSVAILGRVIAILLGFAGRVVFTHTLSEVYVGINGLFTDILNVLALSELGVETAITYVLYKPIAEGDVEKQKSLMRMYRDFYRIVAGMVLVLGLMVIPFMNILVKSEEQVEHLILIYLMYLGKSVLSYLLIYKKTLIDAHQLSYIGTLYQTTAWSIQNILQMIVLVLTKNFILYVVILIVGTVISNYMISAKAEKMYPFLRDKQVTPLPEEERKGIFKNVRAMLMHKIGDVVVNNTDNLLISSLVSTIAVGCYSNYFLIVGSVRQLMKQVFTGITASVGNLGVKEGKERIKTIFDAAFFMNQWICGMITVCMYEVLDLFVEISFGKQYVFAGYITLIICLNFYFTGMRETTLIFRNSMGVFWYDRYKSIAEAIINLVVSIWLGSRWGVAGIFLGTLISTMTTSFWIEPYMLHKHRFERSVLPYFVKYVLYTAVTFLVWFGLHKICVGIDGNPWLVCCERVLLCLAVLNLVYFVCYHRTKEFALLWEKGKHLLKRLGRRA